jgi:hypothetical protein
MSGISRHIRGPAYRPLRGLMRATARAPLPPCPFFRYNFPAGSG